MGLAKQAKVLSKGQADRVSAYLATRRNGRRNQLMFLLSIRAGLRAKEIAALQWFMVLDANGELDTKIQLTDAASKGKSGRMIPIARTLRASLQSHFQIERCRRGFSPQSHIIRSERSVRMSAQAVVNAFHAWYRSLGLIGCSSHSGRRTFITNAARAISSVGGSLRDVQALAGHSSLHTTQRYIEFDDLAQTRVVELL